jgi:hypothetical protein
MTVYGTRSTPPPQPGGAARRTVVILVAALAVAVVGVGSVIVALTLRGHGTQAEAGPPPPKPAQTGASPVASPSAASAGATFTLSAVGDTIVASAPNAPPNNGRNFFDDVRDVLAADLQMGNLEEPMTDIPTTSKCSPTTLNKTCFAFRAPTSCVRALTEAGFSLMNLANNHALDYGAGGHRQTEDTLTRAGIKYTGPPDMITTVTVKGVRVAVIGFAPYSWANSLTDLSGAAELVRKAKTQADVVIVQAHVGAEGADKTHVRPGTEYFVGENRGDSIAFGHAVVDAGADLVIMHGPHVMRAMEFYKNHLIAYSMGNFAGYYHALNTAGVLGISGVLRVTLDSQGHFVAGKLVATQVVTPGVPRMDPNHRAWTQLRSLIHSDFPTTGAKIGTDGTITPP